MTSALSCLSLVIKSISGHKTETMLDHYAEHIETDSAIDKMKVITEHLFLPMVDEVSNDKITYEITDAEIKDCNQTDKEDSE